MSWSSDFLTVREFVMDSVQTVWPGILVAVDAPEKDFGVPLARVRSKELQFESDSILVDRLVICFEILVRRRVESGVVSEALLLDAEALRTELLADVNPAGVGELPMVTGIWLDQGSSGDEEFELRMEFMCEICAERGG